MTFSLIKGSVGRGRQPKLGRRASLEAKISNLNQELVPKLAPRRGSLGGSLPDVYQKGKRTPNLTLHVHVATKSTLGLTRNTTIGRRYIPGKEEQQVLEYHYCTRLGHLGRLGPDPYALLWKVEAEANLQMFLSGITNRSMGDIVNNKFGAVNANYRGAIAAKSGY